MMKTQDFRQRTDKELIAAYQSHSDQRCLEELYRRYYQKVKRYCFTILKDRDTAEDLAQDTFVRVANHLSGLKKPDTFISWLFHIARNLCIDHLKRLSKNKAEKIEETLDLADEILDIEELEAKEHQIAIMEVLIERLSQDDKTMLKLKYVDKLSIKDIQEEFDLSESAVKMRLARARKKVLRLYDKEGQQIQKNNFL